MSIIRRGSEGSQVTKLQNALKDAGYKLSADGVFGPGTEKVVKQFQRDEGLTADGIVGRSTWSALEGKTNVEPEPVSMEHIASFLFPYQLKQQYRLKGAQAPSNPPGMQIKRIGDEYNNCVLFTSWLLSWAFDGAEFTYTQWKEWMCSHTYPGVQPVPAYGPKVAMDWGIAKKSPEGTGPWLLQTFTQRGGHSYIVLDHDPATGKILTLESNAWCNGAGWHQIGALRDVLNPGPNWMDKVTQTWENRVFGPNVAVHMVELNITGVKEWLAQGEE